MIRRLSTVVVAALGLVATTDSGPLHAQVAVQRLSEPDASFPEAFSLVQGLVELPDGRVMIADPLGQALVIADLDRGVVDTLGSVGQGPEEYRQPDGVFALPGDSTLLVDLGNTRLTVIAPDGSFGATMPIAQDAPGPGPGLLIVLPQGVDSRGRIYFQPFGGARGPQLPDSAAVMRLDRGSGAMDTVAMVKLPEMKQSRSGGLGQQAVTIMPVPLSPLDEWAVSWDGRVAVARADPYHVEWIHTDGTVVRSGPIDFEPVRIRRADKLEWIENLGSGVRIGIMVENGRRRVSMGRGGSPSEEPDIDSFDWPETKPAFANDGVWVTPQGDMWVQRHVSAGEAMEFDVFGANAALKGKVVMPAGREVVGFGRGTVYAVRTDELGLQWLERYRRSGS
ncbi:MAG: hypothetical protein JSV41_05665 [Gemmatimonadota bacterium]|nr:MAG: hypothetical protein JSV41_05665 [Gemmatimonadota bacterium]